MFRFAGVTALVLLTAGAWAQTRPEPSAEDRATARALLDEGDALAKNGDDRGALEKYKAADDIMQVPSTGTPLARTEAKLGMLVEAADVAARVIRYPSRADEPEAFAEAQKEAARLLDDVNPRIPSVTLKVAGEAGPAPGAVVTLDGRALTAATQFQPRRLNPGHHEVTIAWNGRRGTTGFDLKEGDKSVVEVPLTEAVPMPPPPPPAPPPHKTAPAPDAVQPAPIHPAVWVGVAVAGAGVVAGAITGGITLARRSTLNADCPKDAGGTPVCATSQSQDELDASYRLANASTACFAVAGAGAVVALTSWLVTRGRTVPVEHAVMPLVGPGFVGARGEF